MTLQIINKTQDRAPQGFPSNHVKGMDYYLITDCGGKGAGGDCACLFTGDFFWWAIKVSPYSTYNRHLVLQNNIFQIWNDGGPSGDGSCANTFGTLSGYTLYLSYTKPVTKVPANVTYKLDIPATAIPPTTYNFDNGAILPQPNNPNYDGNIYVTLSLPKTNMATHLGNGLSGCTVSAAQYANYVWMDNPNLDFDSRI